MPSTSSIATEKPMMIMVLVRSSHHVVEDSTSP